MKYLMLSTIAVLFTTIGFSQTSKKATTTLEGATVTITNSDHNYSLIAVFGSNRAGNIQALITQALGVPNEDGQGTFSWKMQSAYTVTLKTERLMIDLDKSLAEKSLMQKFERLGADIQQYLAPAREVSSSKKN